jgi:hypothetical protein
MNFDQLRELQKRQERRAPGDTLRHGVDFSSAMTLNFFAGQALVEENIFKQFPVESVDLPQWEVAKALLPQPIWPASQEAVDCYWDTWKTAFKNVKQPPSRHHVANYIDTAFNGGLFLWDSVFILAFAKYGLRTFPFQQTLNNLYANQMPDGFITRELRADGAAQFHPHDPASTGPNILAWSEWQAFELEGDEIRLACVFPVILAYHRWMRLNRSWPDGSYYSCGLACGMDNMRRVPEGYDPHVHHGHLAWIDATSQAALSCDCLLKMAKVLGRECEVQSEKEEYERLSVWVREVSWDEELQFACDINRQGKSTAIKQVGGYWAMLAGLLTEEQAEAMAEHLRDPKSFNRLHRVPTLAADQPGFSPEGDYWNGSVWAPTTWMVLKALERYGFDDLAYQIGLNHHDNVVKIWQETGTVWENYSSETLSPGKPAKRDFVGWTGLPPIAVLLEHRFGLRADVSKNRIVWDIRICDEFGVKNFPLGKNTFVDLHCAAREHEGVPPVVTLESDEAVEVEIRWKNGRRVEFSVCLPPGV